MKPRVPRQLRFPLVAALASVVLGLTTAYALAQAPPSAEEAERRKAMGGYHPERMKNPNLTGHQGKMTVTAPEDIPLKRIQVPAGFQVELWAHGNPGARMMARGDLWTIYQGTRTIGRVYATMDKDGKRTSRIIAEKLVQPNGVLFHNGALYVAAIHRVFRYDNIEASLAKGEVPTPVELTDAFRLPTEVATIIGADFGFPYCHANGQPDPDIKRPNPCDKVILPVATLGPHAAALGMRFYTGTIFPADYRDAIFVARRGSWNRTEKMGYDVLTVRATPDGKNAQVTRAPSTG